MRPKIGAAIGADAIATPLLRFRRRDRPIGLRHQPLVNRPLLQIITLLVFVWL